MKRMCIWLLVFVLLVGLLPTAVYAEEPETVELPKVARMMADMLPALLGPGGFGVTEENCEDLYVGDPILCYGFEKGRYTNTLPKYPLIHYADDMLTVVGLGVVHFYPSGELGIDYGIDFAELLPQSGPEDAGAYAIAYIDHQPILLTPETLESAAEGLELPENIQFTSLRAAEKVVFDRSRISTDGVEMGILDIEMVPALETEETDIPEAEPEQAQSPDLLMPMAAVCLLAAGMYWYKKQRRRQT